MQRLRHGRPAVGLAGSAHVAAAGQASREGYITTKVWPIPPASCGAQ
jgi:hypothetical protein